MKKFLEIILIVLLFFNNVNANERENELNNFVNAFPNYPNASENCQISDKNGGQMIQIMAWAGLGARVGTRTSG